MAGWCEVMSKIEREAVILARSSQRQPNFNPLRSFCADGVPRSRPGEACILQFLQRAGCRINARPKPMEVPMATISWLKDVDAALAAAKTGGKPLLVDFSAAPM